jgi:hypothetical protein
VQKQKIVTEVFSKNLVHVKWKKKKIGRFADICMKGKANAAEPDTGSGTFLTPGPGSGMGKYQDSEPG